MNFFSNDITKGNPFKKNKMILFLSIISLFLSLPIYFHRHKEILGDNDYFLEYFSFLHPFFYSWFQIIGHMLILLSIFYIIFSKRYVKSIKIKYTAIFVFFILFTYQYYSSNIYISNYFHVSSGFFPISVLVDSIIELVNTTYIIISIIFYIYSIPILMMAVFVLPFLFLNLFHGEERFKIKDYGNLISKGFLPISFILFVAFSLSIGFNSFIHRSKNIYSYAYTFDARTFYPSNKCSNIEKNNNEFRFIYGEKGKKYKFSPPIKNKEILTYSSGRTYSNPKKDLRKLTVVQCKS